MSVVTVTRQSKHHFTDDLKIKKQKTAKHGCTGVLRITEATDLSHCLVVLGGETKQAGWSGALYSIEREIARSTASLLTLMYDFFFRLPKSFSSICENAVQVDVFSSQVKGLSGCQRCLTNPRAAVVDSFGHGWAEQRRTPWCNDVAL